MQFNIQDLKKLLSSTVKHKVTNINIKSTGLQITISNTKRTSYKLQYNPVTNTKHFNAIKDQNDNSKITKQKNRLATENEHDTYFTIISPMIGTFYRSPAPNEQPFIDINDIVNSNQTVCIIEAMKLMNEIQAEVEGQIIEILVKDGDIVDCGQALMRVKHQLQ